MSEDAFESINNEQIVTKRAIVTPEDVSNAWKNFVKVYNNFRDDNGLVKGNYNAFEICTALSDKHGRVCRQIKHAERRDHKSDWPEGMTAAMAGYLVYTLMLLEEYGGDMGVGLKNELQSAISQYSTI